MSKTKQNNNTNTNEEETFERVKLPRREDLEQFAIITQLMGSDQVRAMCEDGQERQFRIPGKLKKRVWLRENDFIIVKLWDFQPTKGDVVWRYLGNQVGWLKRKGYFKKLPI
ncbi:MAG: translation initiation factor eIF-1A [Candidatus ainarchaeum sp.]|nr:translation initiation factor eIF-1A [Candidatus ainarchaeum sp.]